VSAQLRSAERIQPTAQAVSESGKPLDSEGATEALRQDYRETTQIVIGNLESAPFKLPRLMESI